MSENEEMKVKDIISRFDAAMQDVLSAINACTDEQWQMRMEDQERSVGVVFHHIAWSGPTLTDWALMVARGEELPSLTMDDIHDINRQYAQVASGMSAEDTKMLLQDNTNIVRSKLEKLDDADLTKSMPMALMGGKDITAQQIIDSFIINHAHGHLQEIQAILDAA